LNPVGDVDGQNRIVGFVSAKRIYEIWVPEGFDTVAVGAESFDPGSTLALSHLAVTDPLGVCSGQIDIAVPSGFSTMLLVVTAPGGAIGTYLLNVTHDVDPPTCNGGAPQSKIVTVGCAMGSDVTLLVDASALAPGPTRFCQLPSDQVCTVDSDCLVPPCRPPVNLVDIPVSTDCASHCSRSPRPT